MKKTAIIVSLLFFASCGPNPQMGVIDTKDVNQEVIDRAMRVQILPENTNVSQVKKYFGPISATSCKNKTWDKPPSKGDALLQLRIKALELGANAIVNVQYDNFGTDAWGTNCWASITASGDAVIK